MKIPLLRHGYSIPITVILSVAKDPPKFRDIFQQSTMRKSLSTVILDPKYSFFTILQNLNLQLSLFLDCFILRNDGWSFGYT